MKKLTLLLATVMIAGAAFAGDGNKGCCKKDGDKGGKACCQKEASAKSCCKKDGEKADVKKEDSKTITTSSSRPAAGSTGVKAK